MKTLRNGLIFGLLLATSEGSAQANSTGPNKPAAEVAPATVQNMLTLKSIATDSLESKTNITLEFDGSFSSNKPAIEDHGSFIQLSLANTIVINPGQFMDGSGPYVQKIVAFQPSPKDAAIRLFVDKKAAVLIPAMSVDVLEKRVLITLEHDKITQADAVAEKLAAVSSKMDQQDGSQAGQSAQNSSAVGMVSEPLPADKKTSGLSQNEDLRGKMVIAAVFCIVLLAFGAVAIVFKPTLRKKFGNAESEIPSFRTLSSHSVGPKQKIAVIKVGSERLLVGITPGSISLLKNLDEVQPRFSHQSFPVSTPSVERARPVDAQKSLPDRPTAPRSSVRAAKPELNAYPSTKTSAPSRASDYEGIEVNLSSKTAGSQVASRKLAKPTLPRPVSKTKPGSVDDVTKLIREKLKNLPQAT